MKSRIKKYVIKKYVKERDAMLLKRDVGELKKFVNNRKYLFDTEWLINFNNASDEILEVTLHKMIVNAVKLPEDFRRESAIWLTLRGFDLECY